MSLADSNRAAWESAAYTAWINRFGEPAIAAERLTTNPSRDVKALLPYIENIEGKRMINLMGSHGHKAVSFALLGAEVTIVDFSSENKRYAMELSKEAGVPITYILSDILQLPMNEMSGSYDVVFMELGILHYFEDLAPLSQLIYLLLASGGRLVIQDFHPISTKLIKSKGTTQKIRKHKVDGDYFSTTLEEVEVSYSKYLPNDIQEKLPKVKLRKWTLGEIVTSIAQSGLVIKLLVEEPNRSSESFDKGIPKTFTLVAEKQA